MAYTVRTYVIRKNVVGADNICTNIDRKIFISSCVVRANFIRTK
jgi:hypothetical protein